MLSQAAHHGNVFNNLQSKFVLKKNMLGHSSILLAQCFAILAMIFELAEADGMTPCRLLC